MFTAGSKPTGSRPAHPQNPLLPDRANRGVDIAGVEGHRIFTAKTELDGDIRAVSLTRFGQRSVEQDVDGLEAGKAMSRNKGIGKTLCGAPWS